MRFADIIGQHSLKRTLAENIDRGRISHAQLFTGKAGAGTLPLALAYAQYLNCTNRHDGDSCGECPSCRQMSELAHPDLHLVFPVNKQGKKSGEVILSSDFMPLWRKVVGSTGGYFTREHWNDSLDLGKTLQGIISTKERRHITASFDRYDMYPYIDILIAVDDNCPPKPDPSGVLLAMERLGGTKEDTLYTGDSLIDAHAAKNEGLDFVAVTTGTTAEEEFHTVPSIAILKDASLMLK